MGYVKSVDEHVGINSYFRVRKCSALYIHQQITFKFILNNDNLLIIIFRIISREEALHTIIIKLHLTYKFIF